MDFYNTIKTRRSVRSYIEKPVPEDILERILNAARIAPSANNIQPWHYIVVKEKSFKQKIAELCGGQTWMASADTIILLCSKRYIDNWSWLKEKMYLVDAAISFDHLILAARNEGLGTCWIGAIDSKNQAALKKLLKIKEEYDIIMATPLGYPSNDKAFHQMTTRQPLHNLVSYEYFGNQK